MTTGTDGRAAQQKHQSCSTRPSVALRRSLVELQDATCLHSGRPLGGTRLSFDHVIPRHTTENRTIHNLLVTSAAVNSHKNGHLPAPRLLAAWSAHVQEHMIVLGRLAARHGRDDDLQGLCRDAVHAYTEAAGKGTMWDVREGAVPLDRESAEQGIAILLHLAEAAAVREQGTPR